MTGPYSLFATGRQQEDNSKRRRIRADVGQSPGKKAGRAGVVGSAPNKTCNLLDRRHQFPNSGRSMGKHDNRTSMKMRRLKAQKKLKVRLKRQSAEKKVARTGGKAAKKTRTPAPAKE